MRLRQRATRRGEQRGIGLDAFHARDPRLRVEDVAVDGLRADRNGCVRQRLRAGDPDLEHGVGSRLLDRAGSRECGLDRPDPADSDPRPVGVDERGLEVRRGDDEQHGATVTRSASRAFRP